MIIGALLGVIATVIYYQIARFCQEYRQTRSSTRGISASDLEGQQQSSCSSGGNAGLEDPNKYLFRKVFKEDSESVNFKDRYNDDQ